MKQKILIFLILISSFPVFSQEPARFGELLCDKMCWGYWSKFKTEWYEIEGCKSMNGKTYGLLQIQRQLFDGSRSVENTNDYYKWLSATIGIRDEGGRVYVDKDEYLSLMTEEHYWMYVGRSDSLPYEITPNGEIVLYDFNKKEGDVYCHLPNGSDLTVIKVDIIKTEDGVSRRRLTLSNGFDLIEGVGCTNSTGFLLFWLNMKPNYDKDEEPGLLTTFGLKEGNGLHRILARDYTATINEMNGHPHKIMTHGRRWVYDYDNGEIKGTLTYSIEGDTLLHAYKRAKLKVTLVDNNTNEVIRSGYAGFLREENDSHIFNPIQNGDLCYLNPVTNEEKHLYQFKWNTGSYFTIEGFPRFVINDDSVTVGKEPCRRLQLVNRKRYTELPKDKDSLYCWVDGIGSSKGLLEYSAGPLMDSIQFVACYDGEECIFTRDDFYKDSGQPSKFVENLWFDSLLYEVRLGEKNAKLIHSDNYKTLNHAVIPSSIELWGENCLVSQIDKEAFKDATSVTSIDIPESISSIGGSAFSGCTGLTSVDIPESVVEIGQSAFSGCTGLTSVIIPKSVSSIGFLLFDGCTGFTSFVVPESVTTIESGAFRNCTNLESVVLPPNLVSIKVGAFAGCKALTSVTIPEGIKKVESRTFYECSSLKEVRLPASIDSIQGSCFSQCTSLKDVYCKALKVPFAPEVVAFYKSSYKSATLHVPAASLKLYKETYPWSDFKYIVPIEDTNAIKTENSQNPIYATFDLQGRPVQRTSKHGVYVKDGRKVIR